MVTWICIDTDAENITGQVLAALQQAGLDAKKATLTTGGQADIVIHSHPELTRQLAMGRLTMDLDNVSATLADGTSIHFTPIEFSVLKYLISNRHRAVSRDELLPAVWGFANDSGTRVADDTVKRLRRKLASTGISIETVWGYGFKVTEV